MGQQVNVYRKLKMFPGAIIEGALGPLFDTGGTTYYVNNITGNATADGLSWNNPMSQPSYAITASAALQALRASGNEPVRNTIVMQGTSTKYTPITTMPLYTNMIGLGSNPRGNAFGNTRMGTTDDSADGAAGDEAGNYWYNIQFSAGGSFWAVDLGVSFSSTWDNCTFGCASDNAASTGGLRVVTAGSGSTFVNCFNINHSGTPATGMSWCAGGAGTTAFNDSQVLNCFLYGTTTGFLNKAYLCGGTIVTGSTIHGGTYGVTDTSTNSNIFANITYSNNFVRGTTGAFSITNNSNRAIGNIGVDNATGVTLTRYAAQAN